MEEETWTERKKRQSLISQALENDEMEMMFEYYKSKRNTKRDTERSYEKNQSIGEDETSRKYKERLKFLKSVNPIGEKEKELFYPPLSKNPPYPFEEDIRDILGEEYVKYSSRILDTVDKSFMSGWMFTKYLENEFEMKNFDSSIPNIDPILKFAKYLYSRIGNSEQYYRNKSLKLEILFSLIEREEAVVPDGKGYYSVYEISVGDSSQGKIVKLYFEPNGTLYLENGNSMDSLEDKEIRKLGDTFYVFVKKSDQINIPDEKLFRFLSVESLMREISTKYFRLGEFVFFILETLVSNISFIKKVDGKYVYPFDHSPIQNTKRFYIIPITLPLHLNILIIDNKMKTIERFEPH